jgi:outer membrane biosynthesis protein TonB
MIKLKRFIHPGLAISVLGHFGLLALGLLFAAASGLMSPPPPEPTTPILPEATVVDIVPPNEAPRFEGTPSELKSSGSESRLKSDSATAAPQPGPAKPTAQPRQQPQQPQQPAKSPQRNVHPAKAPPPPAQPETAHAETAPPDPAQAETAHPDMAQPDTAQPDTAETSAPPPAPPQPEAAADQPVAAETFAQLALVGGQLGGGFAAPAIDTNQAADDFTVAFRERVSSCSTLPAGIDHHDKIAVSLRVSFNPDGTLASPPRPLRPITSPKAQAMMESAINALQKCQPYTMLPADKYKIWKSIDLVFYPMNFGVQ